MIDDKEFPDGPYRYTNGENKKDEFGGIEVWNVISYDGSVLIPCFSEKFAYWYCLILNDAYAEGRKSMEKDFNEAIGWADSICLDWNYSKDYKKWKKARGIE